MPPARVWARRRSTPIRSRWKRPDRWRQQVAEANGVYVDPRRRRGVRQADLQSVGRRLERAMGRSAVQRGAVTARRNGADIVRTRRRVPAGVRLGDRQGQRAAGSLVDGLHRGPRPGAGARLVGSMNDDSSADFVAGPEHGGRPARRHVGLAGRGRSEVAGHLTSKFPRAGFGQINSYDGTYVSSTTNSTILSTLGLTQNNARRLRKYPFPQAGRDSSGLPKSKPSNSTSDSLWDKYINLGEEPSARPTYQEATAIAR